ncbi:MAG: hypothetical protein I3270_02250 [Candidatus Moeniiplasma glomeromycotorum]|nr:hypothetical protein [Candidatus Moeniiplasma glomeromycotorum]MCE8162518.1 hypothetical protein [Candidatus Moeniiplasma glomeromycotorum]MCE8166445.1 hypothetical protein [Candidatus Moeniiplasma glomeromycotorum]MCE8166930.1 hypothetical protein [Candidatus Moeniiplasma glomeromycotorum]
METKKAKKPLMMLKEKKEKVYSAGENKKPKKDRKYLGGFKLGKAKIESSKITINN